MIVLFLDFVCDFLDIFASKCKRVGDILPQFYTYQILKEIKETVLAGAQKSLTYVVWMA